MNQVFVASVICVIHMNFRLKTYHVNQTLFLFQYIRTSHIEFVIFITHLLKVHTKRFQIQTRTDEKGDVAAICTIVCNDYEKFHETVHHIANDGGSGNYRSATM